MTEDANGLIKYLITCLIRREDLLLKTAKQIPAEVFNKPGQRHIGIVWSVAVDWFLENESAMPLQALRAESVSRLAQDPELVTPGNLKKIVSLLDDIDAFDPKTLDNNKLRNYVINKVQKIIDVNVVLTKIFASDDDDVSGSVEEIQKAFDNSRVTVFQPLRLTDFVNPVDFSKHPTGFPPYDELLGGGWGPAEVHGLVAAPAGGKTALAVQLALYKARFNEYVAYMPFENRVQPAFLRRFIGRACGFNFTRMKEISSMLDFTPEEVAVIQERFVDNGIQEHLLIDEFVGNAQGPVAVKSMIQDCKRAGKHPKLIIIDQYLQMLRNYMNYRGKSTNETRQESQNMTNNLLQIAADEEVCILLLHQLTSDIKSKKNASYIIKAGDTMEDKGFDNWLTSCVGLGLLDKHDNVCWASAMKGREGSSPPRKLRLIGEYQVLEDVTHMYDDCDNGEYFELKPEFKAANKRKGAKLKFGAISGVNAGVKTMAT